MLGLPKQKRAAGGVYICDGTNWSGHCGYGVQPLDVCVVLGNDWKNNIASFGPDGDSCTVCFGASAFQSLGSTWG